ncbi:CSL zinc finger domain containing protein, putative [Babesia bigemina]|uniref:CSL zinc finger domain containing protein, putative n=1 Tax=Babesia bigemina TaxID=5866 RepID=A0A061D9X5_BABBI|nr:CSL zinc finger domain containing protein, putative [Babesia bigemina]CDR97516.1 CSL zinc finger domain containing protein, putative [Babesia bigemina]|eukprot:XP_012769702.1 CSL zinc finger domain containing protein, putative [Babesia bigemina]
MLFTKTFLCNLDWDSVTRAFYRMYPSKYYPHVKEVHVIDHELVPEKRQLRVRRIARVKYDLPSIVHYIVGPSIEYFVLEDSVVDLGARCLSHRTFGLTMKDSYTYNETATIRATPNGQSEYSSSTDFGILAFGFLNSTLEAVSPPNRVLFISHLQVARRVVSDFSKTEAHHKALMQAAARLGD